MCWEKDGAACPDRSVSAQTNVSWKTKNKRIREDLIDRETNCGAAVAQPVAPTRLSSDGDAYGQRARPFEDEAEQSALVADLVSGCGVEIGKLVCVRVPAAAAAAGPASLRLTMAALVLLLFGVPLFDWSARNGAMSVSSCGSVSVGRRNHGERSTRATANTSSAAKQTAQMTLNNLRLAANPVVLAIVLAPARWSVADVARLARVQDCLGQQAGGHREKH